MRHRYLARWLVGLALTAPIASLDCGGDDDAGTGTGSAGSAGSNTGAGGSGGTGTSGSAGKGGSTSSTTTIGTATGGAGGSGGSGTAGSGGGKAGGGGTAGSSGSGGSGGQPEGGTDAKSDVAADAPRVDATGDGASTDVADVSVTPDGGTDGSTSDAPSSDAADAAVTFSAVKLVLGRCTGCHRPRDAGTQRLDLATEAGLYDRLMAPLLDSQSGMCGFGDGGTDGGDAAPQSRRPIVPGDPDASFLYKKVAGTQPAGCGARMPRIAQTADDGGPAGSVGCDQADGGTANCLSQEQLDTILHWIEQGAPNN